MAKQQTPKQRKPRTRTATNWRTFIDWKAAGRKAYESRVRNLRAKSRAKATRKAATAKLIPTVTADDSKAAQS